jgi:hypothetical protein
MMTLSSTIEMKLRERPPSTTPADAVSKVLGIQALDEERKQRLSNLVHFSYGTLWGSARALLDVNGIRGKDALLTYFTAVWGTALVLLPSLRVAPPVTEWSTDEIAIDAFHHLVYVTATSLAYSALKR